MLVGVGRMFVLVCVGLNLCWYVLIYISGKRPKFWCNFLCNPRLQQWNMVFLINLWLVYQFIALLWSVCALVWMSYFRQQFEIAETSCVSTKQQDGTQTINTIKLNMQVDYIITNVPRCNHNNHTPLLFVTFTVAVLNMKHMLFLVHHQTISP